MNSFTGIFQSFCLYIHNNYFSKHLWMALNSSESAEVNTLSAKPPKWSNTIKQFVGNLRTNCLSLFDPFVGLTFKEWIVFMWSQQNRYLMEESFIFMSAKTGNLRTYFFINYRNTLKILYVQSCIWQLQTCDNRFSKRLFIENKSCDYWCDN